MGRRNCPAPSARRELSLVTFSWDFTPSFHMAGFQPAKRETVGHGGSDGVGRKKGCERPMRGMGRMGRDRSAMGRPFLVLIRAPTGVGAATGVWIAEKRWQSNGECSRVKRGKSAECGKRSPEVIAKKF
jgi:hypothetical protein